MIYYVIFILVIDAKLLLHNKMSKHVESYFYIIMMMIMNSEIIYVCILNSKGSYYVRNIQGL